MAKIRASAAIDFSPPDNAVLLVFWLLPGGTQAISKPPSKGLSVFSSFSSPLPVGCRISYTLRKLLFTCSKTLRSRVFRSSSSWSAIVDSSSLLFLRSLPSAIRSVMRDAAESYCSMASMLTSPRARRRRSSPCTLRSASTTVGSCASSGGIGMPASFSSATISSSASRLCLICTLSSSNRPEMFCLSWEILSRWDLRLALSSTISSLLSFSSFCSSSNWDACSLSSRSSESETRMLEFSSSISFSARDIDSCWDLTCLSRTATLSIRILSCWVEVSIEASDITRVLSASVLTLSASLSLSERWSGVWFWSSSAALVRVAVASSREARALSHISDSLVFSDSHSSSSLLAVLSLALISLTAFSVLSMSAFQFLTLTEWSSLSSP